MNINNISDVILTTEINSIRSQEINFSFIYNNYIENETTFDDNIILDRDVERKNRFIRIEFENNIENFSMHGGKIEPDGYKEFLSRNLNLLANKNLSKEEREFFNKLDNLFSNRKSLMLDNKFEEVKNFNEFYSLDQKNISQEEFRYVDFSRRLSLTKNNKYEREFIRKSYPESYNFNNIKDYNFIVDSESIRKERSRESHVEKFKTGDLLPGLNYFSETINIGDIDDYAEKNAIYCGVYIEKYIFEDNKYRYLSAKYYPKDSKTNSIITKIEDEAVKYGKTYRYLCYNAYIYTTVRPDNRFMLRHYLLCKHPYISHNILCKEYDAPPEPVCLSLDYDIDRKRMILTWEHPSNYEGDVKGYQILKRYSLEEPYKIVKQLEGHLPTDLYESNEIVPEVDIEKTPGNVRKLYFDYEFDNTKMCIYTIRSIDAHGMFSNYGEQFGVYYDNLRNKLVKSLIAYTGSPVMYPNTTLLNKSIFHENIADFVDNLPIIKKPEKFSLYLTPDFVYIKKDESVRKSLENIYQFTLININDFAYKTNKFSIVNFE